MCGQILCEQCGFRGIKGRNARAHGVYHEEHFSGIRLRRLEHFEHVRKIRELDVLLIRPDSTRFARLRTERVSRRAIREPLDEGGHDKPTFYAENRYQIVPALHTHALVVERSAMGVGLLVVERRERDRHYRWNDMEQGYVLDIETSGGAAWSIAHIWLLPDLRGMHFASQLLRVALEGLDSSGAEVGWVTPFSRKGFSLVRRFAPKGFWHAGYVPAQPDVFPAPFRFGQ